REIRYWSRCSTWRATRSSSAAKRCCANSARSSKPKPTSKRNYFAWTGGSTKVPVLHGLAHIPEQLVERLTTVTHRHLLFRGDFAKGAIKRRVIEQRIVDRKSVV